MITTQNNVFHIRTGTYSYLMRVNSYGILEHLHFGAPVREEDAEAFRCRPGLGWGGCLLLDDSDTESSLDEKALEWSGSGRGDYRESPVELAGQSTDFRYTGMEDGTGVRLVMDAYAGETLAENCAAKTICSSPAASIKSVVYDKNQYLASLAARENQNASDEEPVKLTGQKNSWILNQNTALVLTLPEEWQDAELEPGRPDSVKFHKCWMKSKNWELSGLSSSIL